MEQLVQSFHKHHLNFFVISFPVVGGMDRPNLLVETVTGSEEVVESLQTVGNVFPIAVHNCDRLGNVPWEVPEESLNRDLMEDLSKVAERLLLLKGFL